MNQLLFSANSVVPVFIVIFVGALLKKLHVIDDAFVDTSSELVFKVSLPAFVFSEIAGTDFRSVFEARLIIFCCSAVCVSFLIAWFVAPLFVQNGRERGAFVQGAFRGNVAILGLAVMENLSGPLGVAKGAVILAFLLPIFNILAVVSLAVPLSDSKNSSGRKIIKSIVTNPLILAVVFALPFSFFEINLPYMIAKSISYLADISVPLALIGIGGSLSLEVFKKKSYAAFASSFLRIIVFPLLSVLVAYLTGLRGDSLGIIFIVMGCPTAVSSFVMAKAMGSDGDLAASIVVVTTIGSVFTLGLGIFLLKVLSVI